MDADEYHDRLRFFTSIEKEEKRELSPVVPPPGNVNAEMTPGNLADRKSSP